MSPVSQLPPKPLTLRVERKDSLAATQPSPTEAPPRPALPKRPTTTHKTHRLPQVNTHKHFISFFYNVEIVLPQTTTEVVCNFDSLSGKSMLLGGLVCLHDYTLRSQASVVGLHSVVNLEISLSFLCAWLWIQVTHSTAQVET